MQNERKQQHKGSLKGGDRGGKSRQGNSPKQTMR